MVFVISYVCGHIVLCGQKMVNTFTHALTHTGYDTHTSIHSDTGGINTSTHIQTHTHTHTHTFTYSRHAKSHRWDIADVLHDFAYPPHHREADNRRAELILLGTL